MHPCTDTEAVYRAVYRLYGPQGSRGIALAFHDHGTRRGWGVSVTPQPLFTPGKDPVPISKEAGWAPGMIWTGAENLAPPTGIRSPDRPTRSQSLYADWATRPTNLPWRYFWSALEFLVHGVHEACNMTSSIMCRFLMRNSSAYLTRNVEITDRKSLTVVCNQWLSLWRYSRNPQRRSTFFVNTCRTEFYQVPEKNVENTAKILLASSGKVYLSLH